MRRKLYWRSVKASIGAVALLGAVSPSVVRAANDVAGNLITIKQNGAWSWFQDNRAIVNNNQLIFGTVAGITDGFGTAGDVQVTSYNLTSGATTVSTLAGAFQRDDHDAPALLTLPDGRYLAVWEKHGSDDLMWRAISTSAGSTSSWGASASADVNPANDGNGNTYANVYRLSSEGGKIYSFSRSVGYDPNYAVSTDNGQTFTYGGRLMTWVNPFNSGPGRPYVRYASNNTDTIWLTTTEDHPRNYNNSIYAGYVRGGNVYQSNGTLIGPLSTTSTTPIQPTSFTKIFQGDAANVAWTTDLELDSSGNPYTAFTVRKDGGNDIRYHYARFNGTQWSDHEIAYAGSYLYAAENDYSGLVALDPRDPNTLYISSNADPVTGAALISAADSLRHWEIFKGVTSDGGTSWTWSPITSNSTVDNIRPIIPDNASGDRPLIWLRGSYSSYTNYDLDVVALLPLPPGLNHWKNPGGGSWDVASNWNVAVPNAIAASAYFGLGAVQPTSNSTITISGTRTIGSMTFGNSMYSYSLVPGAGGTLALNNASAAALITVNSGNHGISVPLTLTSAGLTVNASAGVLTISGNISGAGGVSMSGSGTLILSGNTTYTGATTVNSGTMNVTGSLSGTSGVTFASGGSGVVRVSSTNGLGSGTINIASSGGAVGPTSRLELSGGITLANAIAFAPRNNSSVSIENIGGTNTLSGAITISVGGTQARVQSDTGQLTLSGPITTSATSARFLYLQGAGNGTVSGVISNNSSNAAGSVNLIKEGPGTWTLSGNNTYTGATTVSGGTLLLTQSSRTSSSLSIADGAKAAMTPRTSGVKTLQVGSLTLGATAALDLADNDLVVNSGSFTTIRALVTQGIGNTTGITSSTSDGSQVLALFDNALVGHTQWNGGTIPSSAIVGKYTYFGDVNLDGQVSGDDYTVIDSNLNTDPASGVEWIRGDANRDGLVTGDDYTTIDSNLGRGVGNPLAPAALVVPEPALAGAALSLLAGRRRRHLIRRR